MLYLELTELIDLPYELLSCIDFYNEHPEFEAVTCR